MQGSILEASAAKSGTILGDDGNRYTFGAADWRVSEPPAAGLRVDFIAGDGGTAGDIFPLPGSAGAAPGGATGPAAAAVPPPNYPPPPPQNNSQLLGWIGIGCLILGFVVPIIVPTVAALVLGLIGADSAKRHRDSTGLVLSRIAWIGSLATFAIGIFLLIFAFAFIWPFVGAFFEAAMEAERSGRGTSAVFIMAGGWA